MQLADVTKGMNKDMIKNFLHPLNYSNLELIVLKNESPKEIIFGKFWAQKELGIDTYLIDDDCIIFDRLKKITSGSNYPHYLLISKNVTNSIICDATELKILNYEERGLMP